MNILPKKSWHVRTRKNIERVHRDEAEAEKLDQDKRERHLRAEQEARIQELRIRAGIIDNQVESKQKVEHFNLFDNHQEHNQTTNADHEREIQEKDAREQKRAGIWNKLVRAEDVNKPWYCSDRSYINIEDHEQCATSSDKSRSSRISLISSIYDPMTAIKNAEDIVRCKRAEQSRISYKSPEQLSIESTSIVRVSSDSSPEIIKEIVGKSCKNNAERHNPKKHMRHYKSDHKDHRKEHHKKRKR